MTSANVIEYEIYFEGRKVATHRQHLFCKDRSQELLKFTPLQGHSIKTTWLDEAEEYHESSPKNLLEWLQEKRWFQTAGKILEPLSRSPQNTKTTETEKHRQ